MLLSFSVVSAETVIPAWLISPVLDFYCRRSCALLSVNCINKIASQSEDLLLFVPLVCFLLVLVISTFLNVLQIHLHSMSQKFSVISVLYLQHGIRLVVHGSVCLSSVTTGNLFQYSDNTLPIFHHFLPTRPSDLQTEDFQPFLVCCVVAVLCPWWFTCPSLSLIPWVHSIFIEKQRSVTAHRTQSEYNRLDVYWHLAATGCWTDNF